MHIGGTGQKHYGFGDQVKRRAIRGRVQIQSGLEVEQSTASGGRQRLHSLWLAGNLGLGQRHAALRFCQCVQKMNFTMV
jgi:hypothetical protein